MPVLAQTIERFDADARRGLFSRWVSWTTDPLVLLQLERSATLSVVKEQIHERLRDPVIVARASQDMWLDVTLAMTSHAAAAGHATFAEALLSCADTATVGHPLRRSFEETAFRTTLILAYQKKDRDQIARLAFPPLAEGETVAARELRTELSESRDFYLALVDLDEAPARARESFARQLVRHPESATLAMNLFVAEIHVARAVVDRSTRRDAYEKALRNFEAAAARVENKAALEPHGTHNVLEALDGAELDDELDRVWWALTSEHRVRVDLVAIRVRNLERRNLHAEAERARLLVRDANGGMMPAGLEGDRAIAPTRIEIDIAVSRDDHKQHWRAIRDLPASTLAFVMGATGIATLPDFLLDLHLHAGAELQRRHAAVATLKEENKVNDLLVSFLAMRVSLLGWTVPDQSRGGASLGEGGSKGGVGARDWTVNAGTLEIAIGEGIRLRSVESANVQGHLTRLVDRYNPQGAGCALLVVYFEGDDFDGFCDRYRALIERTAVGNWLLEVLEPTIEHSNARRVMRARMRTGSIRLIVDHVVLWLGSAVTAPTAGT